MGFQTYTCCICGKNGLTKRNTYFIEGKGRACREHQEAQEANNDRESKRGTTERKDLPRFFKLAALINQMKNSKLDVYQMKKFDLRPDINLLLNLFELTCSHEQYDVEKSLDVIFESNEYINEFHHNFDIVISSITDKCNEKSTYGEISELIEKTIGSAEKFKADAETIDVYNDCVRECMAFFSLIGDLKKKNMTDKEETDEFINIFTVFYKRMKERISNYENSLNIGRIKNMEILIDNVKSIVANIKSGIFEQYKNVSFHDAAKNITELYVKDVKND